MNHVVIVAAAALLLGADLLAASAGPAAAPAVEPAAETRLLQQIKAEIGEPACGSDAQCRTLPVGAKACGGPSAWWPWSEATADGHRLQAWARQLDHLQRKRFEASGMLSNCQFVPDPGAACVAQRCVLRPRGGLI